MSKLQKKYIDKLTEAKQPILPNALCKYLTAFHLFYAYKQKVLEFIQEPLLKKYKHENALPEIANDFFSGYGTFMNANMKKSHVLTMLDILEYQCLYNWIGNIRWCMMFHCELSSFLLQFTYYYPTLGVDLTRVLKKKKKSPKLLKCSETSQSTNKYLLEYLSDIGIV